MLLGFDCEPVLEPEAPVDWAALLPPVLVETTRVAVFWRGRGESAMQRPQTPPEGREHTTAWVDATEPAHQEFAKSVIGRGERGCRNAGPTGRLAVLNGEEGRGDELEASRLDVRLDAVGRTRYRNQRAARVFSSDRFRLTTSGPVRRLTTSSAAP